MWKPLTAYCSFKNEGLVHPRHQESFKFSSGWLGGGGWVFWCKSCCGCVQVFGSFDASWLQISCQGDKYSTHTELIQFSAQGLHQLPVWSGIKWKGSSVKPPQVWEEGEHSRPAAPEVLFLDSSASSGGQGKSVPNSSKKLLPTTPKLPSKLRKKSPPPSLPHLKTAREKKISTDYPEWEGTCRIMIRPHRDPPVH